MVKKSKTSVVKKTTAKKSAGAKKSPAALGVFAEARGFLAENGVVSPHHRLCIYDLLVKEGATGPLAVATARRVIGYWDRALADVDLAHRMIASAERLLT